MYVTLYNTLLKHSINVSVYWKVFVNIAKLHYLCSSCTGVSITLEVLLFSYLWNALKFCEELN